MNGLVANKMWEWVEGRCPIRAITNAVNLHYWQDPRIKAAQTAEDLLAVKREMKAVLDLLDHKDINELPEFKGESPSSEMISMFIYNKLKEKIVQVSKVSVWETATSCASYYEE